ncbi:MAG: hypothetical protein LDL12_00880 [Anaerolinea sp.]|nr:hypothetical protein [Anaerolinea sp.]
MNFSASGLEDLETQLRYSMRPVQPRREFVEHLERRLTRPPRTILEERSGQMAWLVGVTGLLIGVALMMLLRWRR